MSTWYPYRLACTSCREEGEIQLLKGIHVSRLPAVKADIREGRFQVYTCGACGHKVQIEVPGVCTDFPNGQYIAVEPAFPADPAAARERQRQVFEAVSRSGPTSRESWGLPFATASSSA